MYRIGYDAKRVFNNYSGLGNYSRALLYDLAKWFPENEYYLYSPSVQSNTDTAFFLDKGRIKTRTSPHPFKSYWRSTGMVKSLLADGVQIYHGLSHEIPKGLRAKEIKSIVTIHDLIFRVHPEWYAMADLPIYDFKCRYACRNADHIIAISDCTKEDIIHYYGTSPDKISVIPPVVSMPFRQPVSAEKVQRLTKHYQLPGDFILYVGNFSERKGLQELIEALALLPEDLRIPLVLVGKGKKYKRQLLRQLRRLKLEKSVRFLEEIDNMELPALYQAAKLFVYPSRYEGFGLPIVEAACMGTPIITTQSSAMPQTAGPGALLARPKDSLSLRDCLQQLLTDQARCQELSANARKHFQEHFSPKHLSQQLIALYEQIMDL
ncbi:MAG: glycosyltransferase family 1 protein [Bacteroidota bacterium]